MDMKEKLIRAYLADHGTVLGSYEIDNIQATDNGVHFEICQDGVRSSCHIKLLNIMAWIFRENGYGKIT